MALRVDSKTNSRIVDLSTDGRQSIAPGYLRNVEHLIFLVFRFNFRFRFENTRWVMTPWERGPNYCFV